jgi:phosphatidylglycerol:prolipoprotein diacylglycerol transferase
MHPVLLEFGNLKVFSWPVFAVVAFIQGTVWITLRATKIGIPHSYLRGAFLWIFVGLVVGGRLTYVIGHHELLRTGIGVLIRWGPLAGFGSALGGAACGLLYARNKLPFWQILDLSAAPLSLAAALIKLGCFFGACFGNGCCRGLPTRVPWGVIPPGALSSYHPTPLYDAVLALLGLTVLMVLQRRKRYDGFLFLMLLCILSLGKILTEFTRGTGCFFVIHPGTVCVTDTQLFCVSILAVALALIFVRTRRTMKGQ